MNHGLGRVYHCRSLTSICMEAHPTPSVVQKSTFCWFHVESYKKGSKIAIFLSSAALLSFSFMLADVADLIINPAKIRANECSIGLLFPGLNLFSESTCDDVEILALFRLLKGGKTKLLVGDWS